MNEYLNPTRPVASRKRSSFGWLLLLPLVVFLVIVAYFGIVEWIAANSNRAQYEQWASAGVPYDNVSLQKDYDERTYPKGAQDWIESATLINWGSEVEAYQRLPYLGGSGEEPATLVSSGNPSDWPGETRVASFLTEMEPVIDLIERASSNPTPVRFPVKFQGAGTLLPHLQNSRSIQRLLSLDCDYAYFNQDKDRALRDLALMKTTTEAYDDHACLVSGLVNVALRGIWMQEVRRTLTHSQWSAEELQALRDSLSSHEQISVRWQEVMLRERAFGLSFVEEPPEKLAQSIGNHNQFQLKFYTGPSEVKTLIDVYQRIIELPIGPDVSKWRKRAAALDDWVQSLPSNSLAAMLAPACSQCLEAEIRAEETRRWTLTAVALQQFKQQNERWPKDLEELDSVGLSYEDYSDVDKNVFGYEVDGDKVFLWKQSSIHEPLAKHQISKTRPLPDEENKDLSDYVVELN